MTRLSSLYFLWIIFFSVSSAEDVEMDFYKSEQRAFASVDFNEDGKLTKNEFLELVTAEYIEDRKSFTESNLELLQDIGVEATLSEMDEDGDGELSDNEVYHALQDYLNTSGEIDDLFESYDTDGDGLITWMEFYEPEQVEHDTDMDYENEEEF